jgi:hypothetical protein
MIHSFVIFGPSGGGKTTAHFGLPSLGIVGLPPEKLLVINCAGNGKKIPVRGALAKRFSGDIPFNKGGNMVKASDTDTIRNAIKATITHRPDINYILVDDAGVAFGKRVLSPQGMEWSDWQVLAGNIAATLTEANDMTANDREIFIIFTFHPDEADSKGGGAKIKIPGSMLNKYINSVEALFSTVLFATVHDDPETLKPVYRFLTNRAAGINAKSLPEMYDLYIPNDMHTVISKYCDYFGITMPL